MAFRDLKISSLLTEGHTKRTQQEQLTGGHQVGELATTANRLRRCCSKQNPKLNPEEQRKLALAPESGPPVTFMKRPEAAYSARKCGEN